MNFCTNCGNRLEPGLKFCTGCGTPVAVDTPLAPAPDLPAAIPLEANEAAPSAETPSVSEWQPVGAAPTGEWQTQTNPVSTPTAAQPAASSKSGCLPAILITLVVFAVIAALAIGGIIYVGYKVKQKATEALHKAIPSMQTTPDSGNGKSGKESKSTKDDATNLLNNLSRLFSSENDGDLVNSVSDRDDVPPCPTAPYPSQSGALVPLQEGTVITTAWGVKYGDVESRLSIGGPSANSLTISSGTEEFKDDNGKQTNRIDTKETICNADFALAPEYLTATYKHMPHLIHGVTRLRLSDKSFNQIKTTGKLDFRYMSIIIGNEDEKPCYDAGTLTRVEPQDVQYPLIVNDQRVTLPTIHLTGIMDSVGKDPRAKKDRPHHSEAEVYVIDDPLDPMVLLFRDKDPVYRNGRFRIELTKIDYPVAHPVNIVEKQLTEQKKAVTYGIYFDFNKDTLKPESDKVLKEIVQAMTDNPDWKLAVDGHTDNIGGDSYNLDLSKRRAAAVKAALVSRFHIAADRLTTDGFGASRPIDTNDTLEGRARNRRVELTRE